MAPPCCATDRQSTASHIVLIAQPDAGTVAARPYDQVVSSRVICWQRLDAPGTEWCAVGPGSAFGGRRIDGIALVALDGVPWRVGYEIELDEAGRTRRASVDAQNGDERSRKSVALHADGRGEWRTNGQVIVSAENCLDVDLGFSPVTNSLPIWRLGLGVGERRDIRVAWVLFPSLEVVLGEQSYERAEERLWRYRSKGFAADLIVGDDGLVEDYAGYWRVIARTSGEYGHGNARPQVLRSRACFDSRSQPR